MTVDMTGGPSVRAQLGRFVFVAVAAAGLALGSSAIAAAEDVWDIEAFDKCLGRIPDAVLLDDRGDDAIHECCWKSGGNWNPAGSGVNRCSAPPARTPGTQTPGATPGEVFDPGPYGPGVVVLPTQTGSRGSR